MRRYSMIYILLLLAIGIFTVQSQSAPTIPQTYIPEVLNEYPHDNAAYTQGLLWRNGLLYESTGLRGQSSLREVDPLTGEVLRQVDVRRPADQMAGANPPLEYFAEGLELVDDTLIQLTWQEGEAFLYDFETFERIGTHTYEGEGWGICYDGRYLFVSDGSPYIAIRDAENFDLIVRFLVTFEGRPLQAQLLNELECVGDVIYANLWQTNYIVMIDKFNGNIIGLIDAELLLTEAERAELEAGAVLNGIAYNPETETFFITGKLWDTLFEVRFVPAESE